jgi:hypothetical protein
MEQDCRTQILGETAGFGDGLIQQLIQKRFKNGFSLGTAAAHSYFHLV